MRRATFLCVTATLTRLRQILLIRYFITNAATEMITIGLALFGLRCPCVRKPTYTAEHFLMFSYQWAHCGLASSQLMVGERAAFIEVVGRNGARVPARPDLLAGPV